MRGKSGTWILLFIVVLLLVIVAITWLGSQHIKSLGDVIDRMPFPIELDDIGKRFGAGGS